jgi:hypothetical protein
MSGYTDCACRDCFDVAVSDDMDHPDLCGDCEGAGCSADGDAECQRDPVDEGTICPECLCWVNRSCQNAWHSENA